MGSMGSRLAILGRPRSAWALAMGLAGCLLGGARPALACAVCASGPTDNRAEFILTTAFMTALPLLLVGGLVLFLRARARRLGAGPAERPRALGAGRRAA